MNDTPNVAHDAGPGKIAWTGTAVTLAAYLALMLAVAYIPGELGKPAVGGSILSIGLIAGVAVIALLMIASAAFTYWRNRTP